LLGPGGGGRGGGGAAAGSPAPPPPPGGGRGGGRGGGARPACLLLVITSYSPPGSGQAADRLSVTPTENRFLFDSNRSHGRNVLPEHDLWGRPLDTARNRHEMDRRRPPEYSRLTRTVFGGF
jgi:hypothetical protein